MSLVPFSFNFSVGCPVPNTNITISVASYTYGGMGTGSVSFTLEARRQSDNSLVNLDVNVTVSLRITDDLANVYNISTVFYSGTSSVSDSYNSISTSAAGISEFVITNLSPSSSTNQTYYY